MKTTIGFIALVFSALAGPALAQNCENGWNFAIDGGFEADAPEAYSGCGSDHSVGVLCIGSAIMVTYSPPENALTSDLNGGEYFPITMTVGDFVYADYVNFMGATGEFSFVRVAWDSYHPLFESLQSGSRIEVAMPDFNLFGSVSLSGSRGAIGQVLAECQGN